MRKKLLSKRPRKLVLVEPVLITKTNLCLREFKQGRLKFLARKPMVCSQVRNGKTARKESRGLLTTMKTFVSTKVAS